MLRLFVVVDLVLYFFFFAVLCSVCDASSIRNELRQIFAKTKARVENFLKIIIGTFVVVVVVTHTGLCVSSARATAQQSQSR